MPVAPQRHAGLGLEQMQEARRRKPGACSQLRQSSATGAAASRMRRSAARIRARPDRRACRRPSNSVQTPASVVIGDAAFGKSGQNLDDGGLPDQVEGGARRDVLHPRLERRQIAARADRHRETPSGRPRCAGDAACWAGSARCAPNDRRPSGSAGSSATSSRAIERDRQHRGGVAVRRQSEGRPEIEHARPPADQFCALRPCR